MKSLLLGSVLSLLLLLSACGKVLTIQLDGGVMRVTDKECSVPSIKAFLNEQAQMGILMGQDPEKMEKMVKDFKDATVEVQEGELKGKILKACVADQGSRWYVVDETGNQGPVSKEKK